MRTRTLLAVLPLLVAVACTGGNGETDPPAVTGPPPPTSDVQVRFVPGEWTYELYGVKATFSWKDGQATLNVKNGSDQQVGAPGLYVMTRDQQHVDGTLDGSKPLAPSQSGSYPVSFPGGLQPDQVGLVVLLLGDANWGALGPKIAAGG